MKTSTKLFRFIRFGFCRWPAPCSPPTSTKMNPNSTANRKQTYVFDLKAEAKSHRQPSREARSKSELPLNDGKITKD